MRMFDCPNFTNCSAPICPLSKKSINRCAWMIGESICSNVKVRKNHLWTIKQRKLNKKIKNNFFEHGLFTAEMLEHLRRITTKTTGLIDIKKKQLYKTWIDDHPITTKSLKQAARDLKLAQNGARNIAEYRLGRKKT